MIAFVQKLLCTVSFLIPTALLLAHPVELHSDATIRYALAPPDTAHFYYRDTFCADQNVLINNNIYGPSNPTGTELLPGAAADGSDSIIHVALVFRQPAVTQLMQFLCAGDTLWVAGVPYHEHHWLGEETIENAAANGCDSIIQVNLQVLPAPHLTLTDTLCPEDFRLINGQRYDRDHPTGIEVMAATAPNGCDSTIEINLTFRTLSLSLGPDQSVALGDEVCLIPQLDFTAAGLLWSPPLPCPDLCPDGCFQPLSSGNYTLVATDAATGCTASDAVEVRVTNEQRLYFPTAFKPGGESLNDHFYLSASPGVVAIRRLLIADRWGEIVFEKENFAPNSANEGWDGRSHGKDAAPGVYVFWAELQRLDGSTIQQGGSITLVR